MNITYGIKTGGMFSDYVNMDLFGSPVNTFVLYWILWAAVTADFDVFDLSGKKVASFKAHNLAEASKLWRDGSVKGCEKVRGLSLIRNRANGAVAKVRAIR